MDQSERLRTNLEAVEALLASRPVPPTRAALARSLASAIDAEPETGLAALAKEYRALLEALEHDAPGSDPFAALYAAMDDASEP